MKRTANQTKQKNIHIKSSLNKMQNRQLLSEKERDREKQKDGLNVEKRIEKNHKGKPTTGKFKKNDTKTRLRNLKS